MDFLLVFMRLLHIVLGVFWAGALIFHALWLIPALRDAGPEGAKVAAGLMRRHFFAILPAVGGLTILSGFWLYWRASLGFQPAYMRSSSGMTYGVGALAAIVALVLGVTVMRPSMLRAAELSQAAGAAPPHERETKLAQAQALRARGAQAARIVALLLAIATGAMAVGRYV
jgi:hypothetical protein